MFPQYPETAMITRKRGRSSLNADVTCTSTSHEIDRVSKTSNTSETNMQTSPESDTNDWGLDDLLGFGFNWDLDNEVIDAFGNFESQTAAGDEKDQSADVATSFSRGAVQRSKLKDVSRQIINKNAIAARMNRLKKKEYVSGLEQRVGSLTTENRVLKQENGNLNKRVEELENETRNPTRMTTIMPCRGRG
ncbi:CREB/ATF bZIP transcription factor-like isoform X2 [Carassius carassius]|uniref:CREB/ATF bZIP transcription factor-like isoform X2 n=1 Tax=Carassius carassius TaxID=217509 RepID=UPI0028687B56|nr:CREB/ATF bZIP transcription factor-like isoform X2 [Carassius carassius]